MKKMFSLMVVALMLVSIIAPGIGGQQITLTCNQRVVGTMNLNPNTLDLLEKNTLLFGNVDDLIRDDGVVRSDLFEANGILSDCDDVVAEECDFDGDNDDDCCTLNTNLQTEVNSAGLFTSQEQASLTAELNSLATDLDCLLTEHTAQCNDGADNEPDGFTDYPSDSECGSLDDNDESTPGIQQILVGSDTYFNDIKPCYVRSVKALGVIEQSLVDEPEAFWLLQKFQAIEVNLQHLLALQDQEASRTFTVNDQTCSGNAGGGAPPAVDIAITDVVRVSATEYDVTITGPGTPADVQIYIFSLSPEGDPDFSTAGAVVVTTPGFSLDPSVVQTTTSDTQIGFAKVVGTSIGFPVVLNILFPFVSDSALAVEAYSPTGDTAKENNGAYTNPAGVTSLNSGNTPSIPGPVNPGNVNFQPTAPKVTGVVGSNTVVSAKFLPENGQVNGFDRECLVFPDSNTGIFGETISTTLTSVLSFGSLGWGDKLTCFDSAGLLGAEEKSILVDNINTRGFWYLLENDGTNLNLAGLITEDGAQQPPAAPEANPDASLTGLFFGPPGDFTIEFDEPTATGGVTTQDWKVVAIFFGLGADGCTAGDPVTTIPAGVTDLETSQIVDGAVFSSTCLRRFNIPPNTPIPFNFVFNKLSDGEQVAAMFVITNANADSSNDAVVGFGNGPFVSVPYMSLGAPFPGTGNVGQTPFGFIGAATRYTFDAPFGETYANLLIGLTHFSADLAIPGAPTNMPGLQTLVGATGIVLDAPTNLAFTALFAKGLFYDGGFSDVQTPATPQNSRVTAASVVEQTKEGVQNDNLAAGDAVETVGSASITGAFALGNGQLGDAGTLALALAAAVVVGIFVYVLRRKP